MSDECLSSARDTGFEEVIMAGPLLETKLHVPRRRQELVARPRLIDRLGRGAESALTLFSFTVTQVRRQSRP